MPCSPPGDDDLGKVGVGADILPLVRAIETEVNNRIRLNADVATRLMTPDDAVKAGALALFGEKYGDEVRVVSMGGADDDRHFSTELCGGTHVRRAGDIGLFKIVGEGAVAAGVRRIDALTGKGAFDYVVEREKLLADAADALKIQPTELPNRIATLVEERRKLERELSDARRALALGGSSGTGKAANGTWQFKAVDTAMPDIGNINCVKLTITPFVGTDGGGACPGATFYSLPPCRVADTRNPTGPSGAPALAANSLRTFPAAGVCSIPADATAAAIVATVVDETDFGDLRLFPAGSTLPLASTINFAVNHAKANNAIVPLGTFGAISVQCDMPPASTGTTNFLFDVFGYFK